MGRPSVDSSSGNSAYDSDKSAHSSTHEARQSYETDITAYSDEFPSVKPQTQTHAPPAYVESPVEEVQIISEEVGPRDSFATYASTIEFEDEDQRPQGPMPSRRYQCYEPDATPASTHEFARLFPSTRRFMIQHDDSTTDGNLQLRLDTEVNSSPTRRTKKLTLFHLRMKNLQEREFSLRRYCRDSGREVAAAKKRYIKSTATTPKHHSLHPKSISHALHHLNSKTSHKSHAADSGYASEEDEDEDDRATQEILKIITSPKEDIISTPTDSIRLDFSNYAQVILERKKTALSREYAFDYWGHNYKWKREKHHDNGEVVYSYELFREGTRKRVAVIMPDALSAEEQQWEAKQGGWIPACSMRLLQTDVSDHLGDVIVATGLITLTDDCMRRHFHGV